MQYTFLGLRSQESIQESRRKNLSPLKKIDDSQIDIKYSHGRYVEIGTVKSRIRDSHSNEKVEIKAALENGRGSFLHSTCQFPSK